MYHNPTKIVETDNWHSVLQENLAKYKSTKPLVVTSNGNARRNNFSELLKDYQMLKYIPTF